MSSWYTYILQCADNTLYTGVTTDLNRRITEHNFSEKGAKYTRVRRPVRLVYSKNFPDRIQSCKEESRIKKLSKKQKLELISENTMIKS